jgi:hypothetical protein
VATAPIEPHLIVQRCDHSLHDVHPETLVRRSGDSGRNSLRPLKIKSPSVAIDQSNDAPPGL